MKSKMLLIPLALLLAISLVAAGCPAPAPPPPPPPPPPPAPAPPPAPPPPPPPAPKPITEIMIAGGRVGDAWNVLSEALAYYINRDSEWLRATVVATPGVTADHELAKKDPGKYLGVMSAPSWVWPPRLAEWEYYDKMRWIAAMAPITTVWTTYDKEIKTMQDFVGKKVHIKRKGALDTPDLEEFLRRAGLFDKVELFYGGFGSAKGALKDGLVDVSIMMIDHVYPAAFSKGSLIEDLETKGPIYYINMDAEILRDMVTVKPGEIFPNYTHGPIRIFPGALDKKTQPEALIGANYAIFWGADERTPEDIVYEVTRILMKRAGQFEVWHRIGANMTEEFLATYLYSPDLVHPGAMKFYEEQGIELKDLFELLPS